MITPPCREYSDRRFRSKIAQFRNPCAVFVRFGMLRHNVHRHFGAYRFLPLPTVVVVPVVLCMSRTGSILKYTAFSFRQLLDSLHVVHSFSKKGYPFDNACCESFFKYLKKEEISRRTYHSLQDLQLSVSEYIEGFYNPRDHMAPSE